MQTVLIKEENREEIKKLRPGFDDAFVDGLFEDYGLGIVVLRNQEWVTESAWFVMPENGFWQVAEVSYLPMIKE